MERRPDWEACLTRYIASKQDEPYAYGKHDCALFAAGAVKALAGKDFGRGMRGKYRSQASSVRFLKGLGFTSLEQLVDSHLPEKPAALAQRGDIVLSDGALGVCVGGEALFVGQEADRAGLVRVPRPAWQKAWGV